jgi:hypothetical protein
MGKQGDAIRGDITGLMREKRNEEYPTLGTLKIGELRDCLMQSQEEAEAAGTIYEMRNTSKPTWGLFQAAQLVRLHFRSAEEYRREIVNRGFAVKYWPDTERLARITEWAEAFGAAVARERDVQEKRSEHKALPVATGTSTKPITPTRARHSVPEVSENQLWYSIQDLSRRWKCGQTTVRRILRNNGCNVLDFAARGKRGHKIVHRNTMQSLEIRRAKRLQ